VSRLLSHGLGRFATEGAGTVVSWLGRGVVVVEGGAAMIAGLASRWLRDGFTSVLASFGG